MSTQYLSLPALAEATETKLATLKRWRRDGHLKPYTYSGSRELFRIEDVDAAAVAARNAHNKNLVITTIEESSLEADRATYKRIAQQHERAKKGGRHAQLN